MSYYDLRLAKWLKDALIGMGVQGSDYPSLVRLYYAIHVLHKHLPENPEITFSTFSGMLNSEEFLVILAPVDLPPFSASRSKKLFELFNLVREHGLETDYVRFFRLVAPALVADWVRFSAMFSDSSLETMLFILYHICMRIHRASGTAAVFSENPGKIVEDMHNTECDEFSAKFLEDCVRHALYIELSNPPHRMKKSYEKKLTEAINQIVAICDDRGGVTAHDCILRYLAARELTEDEVLNKELRKFKNVGASDVIYHFNHQSQQDEILKLNSVFMCFLEMTKGEMLIYNPSPAILREFSHIGGTPEKTDFVIPDLLEAQAYQHQFSSFNVYGGDSLPETIPRNVLILDSEGSLSNGKMVQLLRKCNSDDLQLLIYAPQTKISNINILLEESGLYVDAILGIPTGVSQEHPAKKALIWGSNEPHEVFRIMEANRSIQLGRGKPGRPFLPVNALYISHKYTEAPREWLYQNLTIKQMVNMSQNAVISDSKRYKKAREYVWSPEIAIFYKIYQRENKNLEGRAYLKSVSYVDERIRYGKRIGALKTRGLRGKSVNTILEKLPSLLFEPERYDEYVPVLEKLLEDCPAGLSLKTIWYILWRDLKFRSTYDDAVCRELFCGECQELSNIYPATATVESILEALEKVCGFREIPDSYLRQLCLIFSIAVERKILHENKLKYILRSVRAKKDGIENIVSRSRIRTITNEEISRIMENLMETDGEYPRYASSSESFYMAWSLFAPIDLVRLRALKWKDIVLDSDMCVIAISKKLTRDNRMIAIYPPYRVPCSPIITMLCQDRLDYLASRCGITAEMLKNEPIFWNDDPCSASDLDPKKDPISHAAAKRVQYEMLRIANIQEDLTQISDGDKSRYIDLSNPYLRTFFCDNVVTKAALKGLETGEVSYILGKTPPDTVDAHYFGFEAPYNLMRMAAIQHRWTAPYEALLRPSSDTAWRKDFLVDGNVNIQSGRDFGKRGFLYFEIEGGMDVNIKIESKYGHEGNITQL